jgi:hypothetical protein
MQAMKKHETLAASIERSGTQLRTVVERFLQANEDGKFDEFPFIKVGAPCAC